MEHPLCAVEQDQALLRRRLGEVVEQRLQRDGPLDLADRAADLGESVRREVPDVGDAAVGDQVAVTGRDLLALNPADDVLDDVANRLREFRLSV